MAQFVEPPVWTLYDPDRVGDEQFFLDPDTQMPFWHYHSQVAQLVNAWTGGGWQVVTVADLFDGTAEPDPVPWDKDITQELARNDTFTHAKLNRDGGWWRRELHQIDAVTIHHTLSDSPHATAQHYVNKDGGRPSIPYTLWVTQTGEILLCVPLQEGVWHDHTGHENTHLSVGMAGRLHEYRPAEVQMEATARVCAWAIKTLPGVNGIDQIKGHQDHISTQCPGWDMRKGNEGSGHWRDDFYRILEGLLLSWR